MVFRAEGGDVRARLGRYRWVSHGMVLWLDMKFIVMIFGFGNHEPKYVNDMHSFIRH